MPRLTKQQHSEIISRYSNGELCTQLAKEYQVDRTSIDQLLRRNNVIMHSKSYVYRKMAGGELDESCFDIFNSNSLYWLGFLMADGAIHETSISLMLHSKDRDHLLKFKDFVSGNQKIIDLKSQDASRYAFCSTKIVDRLASLGVVERKSHGATADINCINSRDFWRGIVDGDGHISNINSKKVRFELCGSLNMMSQFQSYIKATMNIDTNVNTMRTIYRIQLSGTKACMVINHLYKDAAIFLDRKKQLADLNGARGIFLKALVDSPDLRKKVASVNFS